MRKYLITSALPYINGVKHLGNLTGSLLPADVYARFLRREGEHVLFVCATDEHGTPAELSAREAALDVQTYCDNMHQVQFNIFQRFGLSFDYFGRSSSPQNHALTQHFYRKLEERGYIEERSIRQVYSPDDGRFLPDRYVIGTCPKCGYPSARGDQCENCTSVLDPTDLVQPRSALSNSANLEIRDSNHLFLKLNELQAKVDSWVETHENWPRLTTSIAKKWLTEGLHERCITRDLDWGVPVPRDGYEGKVFYVWFDAPIEYIAATKQWADERPEERDWKAWWTSAEDVVYTQFMAKDNVPFHTVFWPAMIIGTGEQWKQADQIKSFHWLTYYGGKFSTSQKRGVFLDAALDVAPADTWRYFLMAQSPETDDTSFTWELFASIVNKDLVGVFGNFVNRTLKLASAHFGNQIPEGGDPSDSESTLTTDCAEVMAAYRTSLRDVEFRRAVQKLRELWTLGNLYLDAQAPWGLVHTDRARAAMVLRTAINLIRLFAVAASPVIPFSAEIVSNALGLSDGERNATFQEALDLSALAPGRAFTVPDVLFQRIGSERIAELTALFGGATAVGSQ